MAAASRPRILVAEDDADVGRYIEVTLGVDGYDIHRATDGLAAMAKAIEVQPDLIVLDIGMPGQDGVSVCRQLRNDPRTSAVPIIMLTARVQQSDKILGLDAGADDYVTKPFDPAELVARIDAALRRAAQLRDVSPLTGMPGNIAISRQLDMLLSTRTPFALVHADLDNFKAFNDCYGFAAGDGVIKATAACVNEQVEATDGHPRFAGHIGGDDFVVVVPVELAESFSAGVVERFDAAIPSFYAPDDRARGWIEVPGRTGGMRRFPLMTVSLGIVVSTSRRFTSAAEMASVATEMKNVAKGAAHSSWCVDRRSA